MEKSFYRKKLFPFLFFPLFSWSLIFLIHYAQILVIKITFIYLMKKTKSSQTYPYLVWTASVQRDLIALLMLRMHLNLSTLCHGVDDDYTFCGALKGGISPCFHAFGGFYVYLGDKHCLNITHTRGRKHWVQRTHETHM
uniref:Uncharacterized protein n=1 Tax=Anolis carolinensis TaxID=28377 RepID=A0A803SWK2_ANOCA